MSDATSAFGTILKKGATAIAEITGISGPGISRETITTTHMESTNGWQTYIGGLKDGGEVSVDVNFLPTNATQMAAIADLKDGSVDTYTIVWSDGSSTEWSFSALVTGIEVNADMSDKLSGSITFKVSGEPTFNS